MFEWLWKKKQESPLYVPPLVVSPKEGMRIYGRLFPQRTKGFVKFDYNEVLGKVPWTTVKSTWDHSHITWNVGELENIRGERKPWPRRVRIKGKIHGYWKKIGYFPCYIRSTYLDVSENDPIAKHQEEEVWPPIPKLPIKEDTFFRVVCGTVALYEICKPVITKKNIYEHQFFTTPTPKTMAFRYFPYNDLTIPFPACV